MIQKFLHPRSTAGRLAAGSDVGENIPFSTAINRSASNCMWGSGAVVLMRV